MYAILIEHRINVVKDGYGKKYMVIPHVLRDAYKTGSAVIDINGEKAIVEYKGVDKAKNVNLFVVYPRNYPLKVWFKVDAVKVMEKLRGVLGSVCTQKLIKIF